MDLDRLCDNRTPMAVRCAPIDDRQGRDVLVVIAKMTWAVSPLGAVSIAAPSSPVRFGDVPISDKIGASIRYPSDLVEEKPGTDVLLIGTAYPSSDGATEQDVSLRVEARHGSIRRALKVYGPRTWQQSGLGSGLTPGPAQRLLPTPLVYELAYGGVDESDPTNILMDRRNPSGTGFAQRRLKMVGAPAPPIEDPRAPLSSRAPAPAGFAPIPAHWSPRVERMGTRDDAWRRERAPVRPLDFDLRHHSCAPPDLWSDTPLEGDEPVEILGATPEGVWRFQLPRYAPIFQSILRGQLTEHASHLDTYLIDATAGSPRRVELTWRIRILLPRKTEHLETVLIFGSERLPEPLMKDLAARVSPARAPAAAKEAS
jgi:hypothetical protein